MSELISGKEALIALANSEEVQIKSNKQWVSVDNCQVYQFLNRDCSYKFRLKPRTITINGIEVPAPFEPKQSEWGVFSIHYLDPNQSDGWNSDEWNEFFDTDLMQFGAWRTEEEIKQIVSALRQVFGGSHDN